MRKNNKGITLIALVVTIIVLLILAGVSIITLTGDNGIITRASKAANQMEKTKFIEEAKLAYNACYIDKAQKTGVSTVTEADIVAELIKPEHGYAGKITAIANGSVSGITVNSGNSNVEVVAGQAAAVITVVPSGTETSNYVLLDGRYYPISIVGAEVTLGEGTSQIPEPTYTLEIMENTNETDVTATPDTQSLTVSISGNNKTTTPAQVTIKYGGKTATLNVTVKGTYTVSYYGEDKTTLLHGPITVIEGGTATYPGTTPTKAETADYTYTFSKWLKVSDNSDATSALATVNSNLSVYASFTQHSNIPTVDISKMGDSVKYGNDTTNWEVFFEDDDNIYLIYKTSVSDPVFNSKNWQAIMDKNRTATPLTFTKTAVENTDPVEYTYTHNVYPINSTYTHYSSYLNNGNERFPAAQKWMSKYLAWMATNTSSNYSDNDNMLGTLFMLDTDVWQYGTITGSHASATTYYNNSLAEYVIGSPTLEMITITRNSVDSPSKTYTCGVSSANGYTSNATTARSSTYDGDMPFNSTWNHATSSSDYKYYWLASPCYDGSSNAWIVYGDYARLSGSYGGASGFRPVVCLKSSVQLVDNTANVTDWIAQ